MTEYAIWSYDARKVVLPDLTQPCALRLAMVTTTWRQETWRLRGTLETLHRQTVLPAEIVVVEASPDWQSASETFVLCRDYPLTRVIYAPRDTFSFAWGMNVGIKRTRSDSELVACVDAEMLFSPTYLAMLLGLCAQKPSERVFGNSFCGFLRQGVDVQGDVHARWDALLSACEDRVPPKISIGALLLAARQWWHEVRGYDERLPFRLTDSDVWRRAQATGLEQVVAPWTACQMLHPWHPTSPLIAQLGGVWHEDFTPVVNPDGWGEIA